MLAFLAFLCLRRIADFVYWHAFSSGAHCLQFDVELTVPRMGVERSATLQLQSLQSERLRGVRVLVVGSHAVRQEVVAAHLRRWVPQRTLVSALWRLVLLARIHEANQFRGSHE